MAVGCIEPVPHDLPDDVKLWHVDLDQLPVRPRSGDLQCRRTQSRRALPVRRRSPPLPGSTSCPAPRARTCARSTAWCAGIPDGRPRQATSARWTWAGIQSQPQLAAVPDRHQRRSTDRRGRGSRSDASSIPTALARRHFTRGEIEQWEQTSGPDRARVFLQGWTRKEACLKALGSGLSLPPGRIEVGLRRERAHRRRGIGVTQCPDRAGLNPPGRRRRSEPLPWRMRLPRSACGGSRRCPARGRTASA